MARDAKAKYSPPPSPAPLARTMRACCRQRQAGAEERRGGTKKPLRGSTVVRWPRPMTRGRGRRGYGSCLAHHHQCRHRCPPHNPRRRPPLREQAHAIWPAAPVLVCRSIHMCVLHLWLKAKSCAISRCTFSPTNAIAKAHSPCNFLPPPQKKGSTAREAKTHKNHQNS